jgi:protein-tyrosine phosphatase
MAEGLARERFRQDGIEATVISMGTLNLQGRKAETAAIEVMRELGIDISGHRSQGLNSTLLNRADAAFGMTLDHVRRMQMCGANALRSSFLLASYATPPLPEIWDPMGGSLQEFRECRELIRECIERWYLREVLPHLGNTPKG